MTSEQITLTLFRESQYDSWGFGLIGGTSQQPLTISEIRPNSIANIVGLKSKDVLVKINGKDASEFTYSEAISEMCKESDSLDMTVERTTNSHSIETVTDERIPVEEIVEVPRHFAPLTIDEEDRAHPKSERSNPTKHNATEKQPQQPAATWKGRSFQFLEETKPVQKSIRPKPNRLRDWNCPWVKKDGGGLKGVIRNAFTEEPIVGRVSTSVQHFYSEPHSILEEPMTEEEVKEMQKRFFEEQDRIIQLEKEKRQREIEADERRRAAMEEEVRRFAEEKRRNLAAEEKQRRDSLRRREEKEKRVRFKEEMGDNGHEEDDEDGPPPLETVDDERHQTSSSRRKPRSKAEMIIAEELAGEDDRALLEQLTEAIQAGMEQYREEDNFEPSAEELIEVLKNLENLASSNPALYKAIVDQIKTNQSGERRSDHIFQETEETSCGHSHRQVQEEENEPYKAARASEENGHSAYPPETRETRETRPEPSQEHKVCETARIPPVEPFPESLPKVRPAAPTIARHQTKDEDRRDHVVKQQQHQNEEYQHQGFYPKPMPDYDYPWAGSLRPISNDIFCRRTRDRRGPNDPGSCPWAGSLRHTGDSKVAGIRTNQKRPKNEGGNGAPPWMGSLRHVKTPAKKDANAYKEKAQWQSKRYPEEDASNPFQKAKGASNGVPMINEEKMERIKNNLKEKPTVSSALLKVLMPKLLQVHESKYDPLEEDESLNIMEEILSMKIGLNPNQSVEDNDEASQMIRAITHGEIDQSVYSQMADDLEQAAQIRRRQQQLEQILDEDDENYKRRLPATPPPTPMTNSSPPLQNNPRGGGPLEIEEDEVEF